MSLAILENNVGMASGNGKAGFHVTMKCHYWVSIQRAKLLYQRDTQTHMFISLLITIDKVGNKARCPSMDAWVENIYIILLNQKKNESPSFAAIWMEGEVRYF